MNINNERLESFIDTIADQAREAMHERADDILKAWHENIEEAQTNEKDFPPLKLAIAASVDLEANRIETALRFTATYCSRLSAALPDPNQPELPIDGLKNALKPGDSLTITAAGTSATIHG